MDLKGKENAGFVFSYFGHSITYIIIFAKIINLVHPTIN